MTTLSGSLKRDVANRQFEVTDEGKIFLPKAQVLVAGMFDVEHFREGELLSRSRHPNIVVNAGINYILDSALSAATPLTAWYCGLFKTGYTPAATDTIATIYNAGTQYEDVNYSEATRPTWTDAGAASQQITNSASKATFSINATTSIYGAFMVSDSTKNGNAGTLLASSLFSAVRNVVNLDTITLTYTLAMTDA